MAISIWQAITAQKVMPHMWLNAKIIKIIPNKKEQKEKNLKQ